MAYMELQIRKLPYGILKKLADQLDMESDGPRDWKALISVMPSTTYTREQVSSFENQRARMVGSPAMALLTDLGQRCKTVKQLVVWLKKIGHDTALDILEYHEEVQITEQPQSQPVRVGSTVTLRCKATGYPAPQYQWVKDGTELPDGIDEELTFDPVTLQDSGKYVCIVSNRMNAEKTNKVELQVLPSPVPNGDSPQVKPPYAKNPPVIIRHPQSYIVPDGYPSLSLRVEVLEQPVTYQWYKDGFVLVQQTRAELNFQPFHYRDEGNYCCRVENSAGDALSNVATLQGARAPAPDDEQNCPLGRSVPGGRSPQLTQKATDKVALVIGNRDYVSLPVDESPLVHTCSDAKMIASILRKPEMGFKVISLMNLTRNEMYQALDIFYKLLGEGVYGLVYFAGHGFEEGGQNYLVPVDTMGAWVPEQAVCAQKMLDEMNRCRTELIVFLLDICRKRSNVETSFAFKSYEFPYNAQAVLGFATSPQSEAYERRQDPNGIYMKHLLKHAMNDAKVEDVLHEVAADVEAEVKRNKWLERQRPEYRTTTTKCYSLRDPIVPDEHSAARQKLWLDIHKLPQKRDIKIDSGIRLEISFEHLNWLSNAIVLCLRVTDLGDATFCDPSLMLDKLPMDVQTVHFHPATTNILRQVVQERPGVQNGVVARCMKMDQDSPSQTPVERISDIYNIQRLKTPLALTITNKYVLKGSREERTKHFVEVFNVKEFGINTAFFND